LFAQEKLCATCLFADKVQPFVAMLSILPLEFVSEKHASGFALVDESRFSEKACDNHASRAQRD
jgi:hypothetical protein